jgi:hypothetical protein
MNPKSSLLVLICRNSYNEGQFIAPPRNLAFREVVFAPASPALGADKNS